MDTRSEFRADVDIGPVVAALDDEDARSIIEALNAPMDASELADRCDIPLSSTYRKLERLRDARLLRESTAIRRDGHHVTQYAVGFERVVIQYEPSSGLRCRVTPREDGASDRLAELWSQIQEET
jgi:IclR helix-turn-helix domain.